MATSSKEWENFNVYKAFSKTFMIAYNSKYLDGEGGEDLNVEYKEKSDNEKSLGFQ